MVASARLGGEPLVPGRWLGRRLCWRGLSGLKVCGLVMTERRRADGHWQLGLLLASGAIVMIVVRGAPAAEAGEGELVVGPGALAPDEAAGLSAADAVYLARQVLEGRAERVPVEALLRALALAILNHVVDPTQPVARGVEP